MKNILCALFALIFFAPSYAQTDALLGQYFQNMQAHNPAFAGMNNFLDINAGVRQQWVGFKGAPKTMYIGANGVLKSNNTPGDSEATKPGLKHGIGGYILADRQGPYKQSEVSLVYAVHVPIAQATYLALGGSPTFYNAKVDLSDIWVKDMVNDPTYQSLLQNGSSNTFLHVNMGLSLYSDKYYVSYGIMEAGKVFVSGNKDVRQDENRKRHHIMGGYRFNLSEKMELIPSTYIRLDATKPALYELNVRGRYLENYWLGVSYRNDKTVVGMLGFTYNEKFRIGYSYEVTASDMAKYNNGSHEINIGLRLFNYTRAVSMW